DWSELNDLIDFGIDVRFVNEGLDLSSRGGRLSADIQAVVAADYIRNLREETIKGFYGRLKQGIFPMPAPIGYINAGAGKPKIIDPVRGPLIKEAFLLYSSGRYSQKSLASKMFSLGLRSKRSGRIHPNDWSRILNNPFYMGEMRIRKTDQSFPGAHEPLINRTLFKAVAKVLEGKYNSSLPKHDFLFHRLLVCAHCGYR